MPLAPEPAVEDLLGDDADGFEPERCAHVGEDGVRCRNQARPGSRYCGIHDVDALDGSDSDAIANAEDLI